MACLHKENFAALQCNLCNFDVNPRPGYLTDRDDRTIALGKCNLDHKAYLHTDLYRKLLSKSKRRIYHSEELLHLALKHRLGYRVSDDNHLKWRNFELMKFSQKE